MYVNQKIVTDITNLLPRIILALEEKRFDELQKLSNQTIHNSSIFQDQYSIELAISVYSLNKILEQKPELSHEFEHLFQLALEQIKTANMSGYDQIIKEILTTISQREKNFQRNIRHIIQQAKIQKGSALYYHGLTLAQSAQALGISQWELYNYIGKTRINDDGTDSVQNLRKRLAYARSLFSRTDLKLVFDAGPIISLALNGLLWSLSELQIISKGLFLIPPAVKGELIDRPLQTKKHKLEAFQVNQLLYTKTITEVPLESLRLKTKQLLHLCNHTFFAHGNPIQIVHEGEIQAIALMQLAGCHTLVVDERTMRYLIETPSRVQQRFERKLHTHIHIDKENLQKLQKEFKGIRTIRSVELLTVAFEFGIFDKLIGDAKHIKNGRFEFYEGLLWGLKLNGCGISDREIAHLTHIQKKFKRTISCKVLH